MATDHSKRIDRTGQRFGRLTLLSYSHSTNRGCAPHWHARCDCGTEKVVSLNDVKRGCTQSCGCLRKENIAQIQGHNRTHGLSRHPLHPLWRGMMTRCYNPKSPNYRWYGARGITVCDRWHNPANFVADMHPRPVGLELDRINNDGPYSPENCRWVSRARNKNNRQVNHRFVWQGREYSLKELAALSEQSYNQLYQRIIIHHWPLEVALQAPAGYRYQPLDET